MCGPVLHYVGRSRFLMNTYLSLASWSCLAARSGAALTSDVMLAASCPNMPSSPSTLVSCKAPNRQCQGLRQTWCIYLVQNLWRAVDHEGEMLEPFVTKQRDRKAALKFLKKSMKRHGRPHILVTDKLRSYGAAMKEIGNADKQETGRWQNNRAKNFHLPFRRPERAMQRFHSMRSLQKFVAVHASIDNHFNQERALYSRGNFKLNRAAALAEWRQLCSA
jgi:putative transposase